MPHSHTTLILARDVRRPRPALEAPAGVRIDHLRGVGGAGASALEAFYQPLGFPADWVGAMLAAGGEAFVAIATDTPQTPAVAAGWVTPHPFYIDEIGYSFTPTPDGDYFFGDFVAPAWRGRKLQRWLIRARLEACAAAGGRWAFSMMLAANLPSLKSYQAEDFAPAARLRSVRVARWRMDRLVALSAAFPHGSMNAPGKVLPFGWRVRRLKA